MGSNKEIKILRVGDPHVRPSNLDESNRLLSFVRDSVKHHKIDRLEILGDLNHTHAIVRSEVIRFWDFWLEDLSNIVETVVLVGNHDMENSLDSEKNTLIPFKRIKNDNLKIIEKPTIINNFGYLPYIHNNEEFIQKSLELKENGAQILICHAEFDGSKYDNGFYAPHGVSVEKIPFGTVISGHIHTSQVLADGKIDYPGTPRWDSISDTNENKGIWVYVHDMETGRVLNKELLSTSHVCIPIISLLWKEGEEQPDIPSKSRVTVELIGSSDWVSKQKSLLKNRVSIKSKITDRINKIKRSKSNSLENFILNDFNTKMDKKALFSYAKEIGIIT